MKERFITLIFSIVLLYSCSNKQSSESGNEETTNSETTVQLTEAQFKNANIKSEKIRKQNISSVLKVNGKIEVPPQNIVSISAQLGGYLKSSQLLPGMKVKKGEIIAVMEDQQYIQLQQDYLTTKTKLVFQEKEYNRQKELNQNKATSDKSFQLTESEYLSQKIAEKALYEKLKLIGINPESLNEASISRSINIYAPIDGFVSAVNVNIGKYVNPSEVLFELVNPTDIHLALTVFEKDISKLYIGQKLVAYTNNEPHKKHPCEIILIGQNLSRERSIDVHCHFHDYDKTLIPGMYMNAEIEIESKDTYVIKDEAIVNNINKNFIFIDKGNRLFEMKEVQIGGKENGYTELLNADELQNENIVSNGAYSLLMSLKNTEE